MEANSDALKMQINSNWDSIKDQFPVLIDSNKAKDDPVKADFLKYVDGLKSAGQLRQYFTLNVSEANLIFTDLLKQGVIRYLDPSERINFLKRQKKEFDNNLIFLSQESHKLEGESIYLTQQILKKNEAISHAKKAKPDLEGILTKFKGKIEAQKKNRTELWNYISELSNLSKDMKAKRQKLQSALADLDRNLPKVIRRKVKMNKRLQNTSERLSINNDRTSNLENRLLIYHDTMDEVRDYLEDTKRRIDELIDE